MPLDGGKGLMGRPPEGAGKAAAEMTEGMRSQGARRKLRNRAGLRGGKSGKARKRPSRGLCC